ncbi:FkbM family methyltransferase [Candidatus Pelagibacter sp.]|nr:FkbM family methyltransferase [Candidatus Pelagibacter sp.]
MLEKFSKFTYLILYSIDKIIGLFSKKFKFLLYLKEYIETKQYIKKQIFNKEINFFIPNKATELRVKRILTKEPGTLEWINNFKADENVIFWDIGANIGLFSIYAAIKHSKIKIFSFEPSTSNLRVLSRNISINNLQKKISINQFPLTNKINEYLNFKESRFQEGCASNVFGEDFDFEGGKFFSNNEYTIYGTSINYLLNNNILNLPDYIKIDVDGIEHLILEGGSDYLSEKKIKSISVEINKNFKEQLEKTNKILEKCNFTYSSSNYSPDNPNRDVKNINTENFIFNKNL